MRATLTEPSWLSAYAAGQKQGWAQAVMAYADYYCVDGSADDDPDIEERLIMHRPPMVGYASRTGTRRNLAALSDADWRLLVSAKGEHRTEGMRYAIDNGAWTAYQRGEPFDESAFLAVVEKLGERADWIVLPDIVQGGLASLDFSLRWKERLRGIPSQLLIAVQNGMQLEDVAPLLSPVVGIFIGGSTEWKEVTAGRGGCSHAGATVTFMSVASIRLVVSASVPLPAPTASTGTAQAASRMRCHVWTVQPGSLIFSRRPTSRSKRHRPPVSG